MYTLDDVLAREVDEDDKLIDEADDVLACAVYVELDKCVNEVDELDVLIGDEDDEISDEEGDVLVLIDDKDNKLVYDDVGDKLVDNDIDDVSNKLVDNDVDGGIDDRFVDDKLVDDDVDDDIFVDEKQFENPSINDKFCIIIVSIKLYFTVSKEKNPCTIYNKLQ